MSHRQTWTGNIGGVATQTITLAAQAHDCLIAWAVTDSVSSAFTWPSGFTEIADLTTTTDSQSTGVAIKNDADGTETSLDISVSSGFVIGGISAFNVRDNTTPQDVTAVTNNNNTGQSSPAAITTAITPTNNNTDLVTIVASDVTANNDATVAFSDTGGLTWTKHADLSRSDSNFFYNIAIGSANQATAAATTVTGTSTFAAGTSGLAIVTIALKSAGGGAASAPPPRAFPTPILNF